MRRPTIECPVPATPQTDDYCAEHLRHEARREDATATREMPAYTDREET
jgi:hypothetical protein